MIDLLSMSLPELQEHVKQMGEGAFRAKQIREWLTKGADFGEMLNLSKALRERLSAECIANPVSVERVLVSKLDGTQKFLFKLADGNLIEGVLMRYHHGSTLCVSTQVGCKMGCAFCASTLDGCVRNLTPGEMLGQILLANKALPDGERVSNVVLMGSGEPLDNYDNVVKFIRLATDEAGLNLSMRGISLSTCGLVPQMRRFADEGLHVTLSLSLHAPNDAIRRMLMPIANTYTIDETIAACRHYVEKTGRRVIFEYALIQGVNDQMEHADELSKRLRGLQCHVNLIPLNAVSERDLAPPNKQAIDAFKTRLEQRHISVSTRREMGDDIQGACGQLRHREMRNSQCTMGAEPRRHGTPAGNTAPHGAELQNE